MIEALSNLWVTNPGSVAGGLGAFGTFLIGTRHGCCEAAPRA